MELILADSLFVPENARQNPPHQVVSRTGDKTLLVPHAELSHVSSL